MAVDEFPHSSPDAMQRAVQAAAGEEGVTADTKYTQDEVNYREAGSSNTRCENCVNFRWSGGQRGTGTCRIVEGSISATGVCDEFSSGSTTLRDLITGEPTY